MTARAGCSFFFFGLLLSLYLQKVIVEGSSVDCTARNASCYVCTEKAACYWCEPKKSCEKYPASAIIPRDCKKNQWYYKQCTVAGYWLIIVVPCVAVFLLLCIGCCIYCCCCRTSKAKKEEKYRLEDSRRKSEKERRNQMHAQRKQDRQAKVDKIRQKYGLYQQEPSYQKLQDTE